MSIKNVTLELSGKPFRNESEELMYSVCKEMFSQWKLLTDQADMVSVLLWVADGSEILEWTGDLSQTFEWAYWCGITNHPSQEATERQHMNTFVFPRKYIPDAKPRPYSWLKRLIEVIRECGAEIAGKPIRIGATFDNGPEFAISKFKYEKHREIMLGHTCFPNSNVTGNARLHADPQPYAAFPEGIPEGTQFGRFLGRQFQVFAQDLGYDYIWLSNGIGFGLETWGIKGALFDRNEFHPEKAPVASAEMLEFWKEFREACPDITIETRGSNLSAGVEIATDACPLREIYNDYKIVPPVNSPWAAINYNTGLEIVAWMSHIAETPCECFPFRFYTHDPWFMNSPWLDRYGHEPWDIFNPLSIARITAEGKIETPNSIAFLTVDNTWGKMPKEVPREVIPHLLEAFENAPDAPGPFTWIYPFGEYCDSKAPDIVFNEDMFIGECVQSGLPLNTVISTANFRKLSASGSQLLDGSVLVVPTSASFGENWIALKAHLDRGGKIIFYGTIRAASPELRNLLGISTAEPLTGECHLESHIAGDECRCESIATQFHVLPQYDGGGLVEVLTEASKSVMLAEAVQGEQKRVVALIRRQENGAVIGYVRSIMPCNPQLIPGWGFDSLPPDKVHPVERFARYILEEMGWKLHLSMREATSLPTRTNISRHDNAFRFAVFAPNSTVSMAVNTPLGAPILTEMETELSNGDAIWHPGKSWHKECRCFVKQTEDSVIGGKYQMQGFPEYTSRRHYSGLRNAEVRFFPPYGFEDKLEAVISSVPKGVAGIVWDCVPTPFEWENTPYGRCAVLRNVSGYLYFAW